MSKRDGKRRSAGVQVQAAGRRDPVMRQMQDTANGWRPLTASVRDLPGLTHERMQEIAVHLWHRNPLGRRIINAQAEWMIGEGVSIEADDPRTQEYLQRYWTLNRIDQSLMQLVVELGLYGEDFAPTFTQEFSGLVKLGVIDPAWVKQVVLNPDDATQPIGLVIKSHIVGGKERRFRTALRTEDEEMLSLSALAERERMTDGEVMITQINKLRTATRGVSDLFALADWLDGYEQLLFAELIRTKAVSHYFWDYEFTGMDQDAIDEYLSELAPPRPLSVFGHNEKIKRKLVGPDSGQAGNLETGSRTFRNHALGGAGQPEHWYGGGGDVNRSTADSMDSTAVKSLTAKQTALRWLLEDRLHLQIDRGIRVGYLRDTPEARAVRINMPDLSTLDVSRISQGFSAIISGMVAGQAGGFVDQETPARMIAALAKHIGVDVDPVEMVARARVQRAESIADDVGRLYDAQLQRRGAA